ncbi:NTP transferase domain-containing protein [Agrobacterium sp. a22-2]|uniref:NTP transferase domain-containing protein n=1 Tax=Agrobacterium sp. a22-2 TaxID=2283840 RepID=UPI0014472F62|nr:molybdopterin-binding/glycosyltransferase family 2 protein [Agrobacterium sp. a22-2]NKN36508.1 NTP transferase domain-containing protein [Agrobacterium sp. a22-2]
MIFGNLPLDQVEGAVLAHAVRLPGGKLSKGRRLEAGDVVRLRAAGIGSVVAGRLEPGDLLEDDAAQRLADALGRDHMRLTPANTGRVNVYATVNGLFTADKQVVDRFNRVDPAITLACLADHAPVMAGDMVATIKIIPLAVSGAGVEAARDILREASPFAVRAYQPHAVTLIATELPSLKSTVMDKTARLLEQRLVPSHSRLVREIRVAHTAEAVAAALRSSLTEKSPSPPMIVIFGASAVCDPYDVIPQAIRLAGGRVEQVGLPVDPGNLLVLGFVDDIPVVGAPGCARSPKENGFDWVLGRLLSGEVPDAFALSGLGVGGLLMEIASRPLPRDLVQKGEQPPAIAVVILAAGRASRMGSDSGHKLLAEFDGVPLVRRVTETAAAASPNGLVVVTGYRGEEIAAALDGLDLTIRPNPDYASGMASSLRAGLSDSSAVEADGVLVMLADMPGVSTPDLRLLMATFRRAGGRAIVRAVADGKRGNPVILPRTTFAAVLKLEGDIGARHIVETSGLDVIDVEIGSGAHIDVDTPEAVIAAGGILKG